MNQIKVPGVLWVALVVAVVAVARVYVDDPLYVEIVVVIAFAVLKSLNLGTAEIEELLQIIARLQAEIDKGRTRTGEVGAMAAPAGPPVKQPNKFVRWLAG